MKTLYISDLDGTLLNPNAEISDYSVQILNRLIEKGINFSIATARTLATTVQIMSKVNIKIPIVMMNGVVIYDMVKNQYINTENLSHSNAKIIIGLLKRFNLSAFMYTIENDTMTTYFDQLSTPHMTEFKEHRESMFRKTFTKTRSLYDVCGEKTVYFSILDRKKTLEPAYNELKRLDGIQVEFYRDVYSDTLWSEELWFLEVFDGKASKQNAVKFLRKEFKFEKIICFGDNLNDLPMFRECDECYAVANAREELKEKANSVIGSNVDNAVASWLEENF